MKIKYTTKQIDTIKLAQRDKGNKRKIRYFDIEPEYKYN
jgi:hypothetical protein